VDVDAKAMGVKTTAEKAKSAAINFFIGDFLISDEAQALP
jgi:hypothetical protein